MLNECMDACKHGYTTTAHVHRAICSTAMCIACSEVVDGAYRSSHTILAPLVAACRRGTEPVANLFDNNPSSVGNIGNASPNPYYIVILASSVGAIKAVWLYARNDSAWGELNNVTVSLSNTATFGAGTIKTCASGITATGQGQLVKVACEGAATYNVQQWVYVQRFATGDGVFFGLAEIRVMRGGVCGFGGCVQATRRICMYVYVGTCTHYEYGRQLARCHACKMHGT